MHRFDEALEDLDAAERSLTPALSPDRGEGDVREMKSLRASILLARGRFEFERNMVCVEPVRTMRDERTERVRGNQRMENVGAVFFEVGGQIHRSAL